MVFGDRFRRKRNQQAVFLAAFYHEADPYLNSSNNHFQQFWYHSMKIGDLLFVIAIRPMKDEALERKLRAYNPVAIANRPYP